MLKNTLLARKHMIDSQIYTNKVEDERVLAAIQAIPREEFVPEKYRGVAYIDEDLVIGEGRFLMEPMIFARLLQTADIKKTDKVLIVGAGTGYAVAVIAALAGEVVGLEDNINFVSAAQENIRRLEINNATFVKAELTQGADRQKPYDLIFINGAVEDVPGTLVSQLKDGGKIVTVKAEINKPHGPYYAITIHKNGAIISETREFQAFTIKLAEFNKKRGFDF